MKKLFALGFAALLAQSVVACAANDTTASDESNVSAAAATTSTAPDLDSCKGRKECTDALVLRALFSSDLTIDTSFDDDDKTPQRLAREIAAEWLGKENDGRISITASPERGGHWKINIFLAAGHETNEDEGDIAAFSFSFTLDGGAIVEKSVRGNFAG